MDHSPNDHSRVKSNRCVSSRHRPLRPFLPLLPFLPFLPSTHLDVQHRADSEAVSHDNSNNTSFKIKSVNYQDDTQDRCKKEKKTAKTTCGCHVATRLAYLASSSQRKGLPLQHAQTSRNARENHPIGAKHTATMRPQPRQGLTR